MFMSCNGPVVAPTPFVAGEAGAVRGGGWAGLRNRVIPALALALLCPATALAGFDYITHWSTYNPSTGGTVFDGPTDVGFMKSNGHLMVVNSHAGVLGGGGGVAIIQADGTYVGQAPTLDALGPVRITTNTGSGDVYVGTYYDAKLYHFTEAGGTLTLADTWSGCTAHNGNGPYTWGKLFGVATVSTGEFYVIDYDNRQILKMNNSGQCTAAAIAGYGTGNATAFSNPTGIAVDAGDNLWVSDYARKVVVQYDSSGTWQRTLSGFSNCGATTNFLSPRSVNVDPGSGDIFVMDSTNGLVKLDSSGNFLSQTKKYNTSTTLGTTLFGGGYAGGYYWAADYTHSAIVQYQNPTRKVSVTASANGTVAADLGGVIANAGNGNTCVDQFVNGKTVVLTASPNSGYNVTWGGDGAGCTGNTCTLTNITGDKAVTANFSQTTHAITVNAGVGGTASCSPNPVTSGASSTCTATPNGGYSFDTWSGDCSGANATCTLSNVTAAKSVTASFVADGVKTHTGASASGSGNITASFTGGGSPCGYTAQQFVTVASVASPPPGVSFPHGLFDFTAAGCASGGTLNFTITYPSNLPAGTQYWKYGATSGNSSPHWYTIPASVNGNQITFSITDGGLGDDDLTANGIIADAGGAGVGAGAGAGAASIPTLSQSAMALLSGLLLLVGLARVRRRG